MTSPFKGTSLLRAAALSAILALTAGLFGPLAAPAQAQNFDKVQIKATQVSGNIYMLSGRGGNIGVSVGEDGAFLVDDQFAPLTGKIKAAIAELTDKPIKFVINTHWHGDHTGGNENLGKAGATIVAHDNVHVRLKARGKTGALPQVTFNDEITFHMNGDIVHAQKVAPAHTDGDVIVHFKNADVIHMGDTFFNGLYTFFDASSGGSFDGIIAALETGLSLAGPNTKIIPGHGPLTDTAGLKAHVERLKTMREIVAKAIQGGESLKDLIAANPTSEIEAAFGKGYKVLPAKDFLRFAYTDLKRTLK